MVGGTNNHAISNYAAVIAGFRNNAKSRFSTVVGGAKNTNTGRFGFSIGCVRACVLACLRACVLACVLLRLLMKTVGWDPSYDAARTPPLMRRYAHHNAVRCGAGGAGPLGVCMPVVKAS